MRKIAGLDCILLVDDDAICNLIHKRLIESAGIDVHVQVSQNGKEAIDYLRQSDDKDYIKPGIIFLDINMPEMNGWQFMEKYQELPEENKVKAVIVMLSTSEESEDQGKANSNPDIQKFLNKSLTPEKLENIIETYFE